MNQVENSRWNLDINARPALNALGELEQKLADAKKEQAGLTRGTKEWAESKKEIKAMEAEIKQVRETMGHAGMTVKQLEGYHRQLNKEIKYLTPGTEEYIKMTEELQKVNTRLDRVRKDVRGVADEAENTKGTWGRLKEWIMGAFIISGIFEAGQMIKQFVGDAVENFKKFQSASNELSANTKIAGQDLKYLEDQAKTLGPQMGKTGDEMLAAYQLMGSAKSELTENAELLANVTKEAITLSQAGKIDLAPATELMAGALNQFNAPASDAGRFINAIAAGAQVGSAEIADMTGALKASGTVAAAANLSFEQTNGALQSLSRINIKGEQAGTMFRNTLIKLMSSTDDLNPQIVGLDKSLENLAKRNLTTAELAKMFGTENVVAAQHLMNHRKEVKEFTTALTGTDEAYKMAAKNNDTLEFKQKQMEAAYSSTSVKLGQILAPALMGFYDMMMNRGLPALEGTIQAFAALAKGLMAVPAFIRENKEMFIALGAAILGMNGTLIAATASSIAHAAAEKARAVWSQAVASAQVIQKIATEALAAQDQRATLSSIAYAAAEKARALVTGTVTAAKSALTAVTTAFTIENIKATASSVAHSVAEKARAIATATVTAAKATLTAVTTALTLENIRATAASVAYSIAEKARALATNAVVVAQALLNAAMRANPIGLVITLVGGIVAAFVGWYNSSETLRAGMAGLWAAVKTVGTVVADVWGALKSLDFAKVSSILSDGARQVAASFTKGYQDQLKLESPKIVAQHQTTLDAKAAANKKHLDAKTIEDAKALADKLEDEKSAKDKELAGKSAANENYRKEQKEAAKKAAEQEAAEKVRAEKDALKAIEDAKIKAIADDQTRELAQLRLSHTRELERIAASKASQSVKASWEKALTQQLERDIAAVEKTHRDKKLEEDKKRIEEISKLENQQRTERQSREYETTRAVLEHALNNERLTIQQRQRLKLDLIDLEHRREIEKIEAIAAAERAKAIETSNQLMKLAGDDSEKKKQILAELDSTTRGIDAKLIADKNTLNAQHNADTKAAEQKSLEERRANQQGFFDALKGLLNGDYTAFTDFLAKKLDSEKGMNKERLQGWTGKTMEILNIVGQGVQLMQQLNQKYLEDQINRNNKERNDKIQKLQQQYQKGLIDKATYESGVANINNQADQKEKELKLKAWKRDQAGQIAMAVINGAMAALKSLATMGWPLGLVGVAASAAMTAINIGMIKRQQPPSFGMGGKIRNAGVPDGPQHGSQYGQSGIALTRRDTGEEVGEMEGGEPVMILSKNTYRNNRRVIDGLLHSSLHRNGAPIYAQHGALFGLEYGKMYNMGYSPTTYDDGSGDSDQSINNGGYTSTSPTNQQPSYGSDADYNGGSGGSFDAGVDFGGSYEDGYNGNSYQDAGDASGSVGATNEQIKQSQMLMDQIARNTGQTVTGLRELSGKVNELLAATNRTADNAGNAANAGWAAAAASNRAADAAAMAAQNDL